MDTGCFQVWVTVHESCCECVCVRVSACIRTGLLSFPLEVKCCEEWNCWVKGGGGGGGGDVSLHGRLPVLFQVAAAFVSPPALYLSPRHSWFSSALVVARLSNSRHWTGCLVKHQCGVTCISVMTDDVQEFP